MAHLVRTDVYVSELLLIDVFFLSYPSPFFLPFAPQRFDSTHRTPKAILIILFCLGQDKVGLILFAGIGIMGKPPGRPEKDR